MVRKLTYVALAVAILVSTATLAHAGNHTLNQWLGVTGVIAIVVISIICL